MIYEVFNRSIFSLPSDMVLCPVSPVGITGEAQELGFNSVYPQIGRAVNQANTMNDFAAGVLICLEADNVTGKRYLVATPMAPHPLEDLSPFYLGRAMNSLRKLLLDTRPAVVTIPATCFYSHELEDPSRKGVSKHLFIKSLIGLNDSLPYPVDFVVVHDKE